MVSISLPRCFMTFCEAYQAMIEGRRVRRPGWERMTCIFMRDGQIYSEVDGVAFFFGKIAQALITAIDWEVVP